MPTAPRRPCRQSGCGHLVARDAPGGRCPTHARAYDQRRGTATERGYDAAWARFSTAWRRQFPWCGMRADGQLHGEHSRCVVEGRRVLAECVDHIVSMHHGGAKYDTANLQSLCQACNRRKNIALEGGFGRTDGESK
jgi:5-methylcytosine-specific restriction enzyme A